MTFQYTIVKNDRVIAGFNSRLLANAVLDMICGDCQPPDTLKFLGIEEEPGS